MAFSPQPDEHRRLLSRLNSAQREAVSTTEGPVLVLAGAGTGKTRVITYRIAHLLKRGTPPRSILALTFTNKAAKEMRERISKLLGQRPKGLVLSTFHSFGMRILKSHAAALGYRANFTIYDTSDQLALLRTVANEVRGTAACPDPKTILHAISRAKSQFLLPEDYMDQADDDWSFFVAVVYKKYQEQLQLLNATDFDDLILLPVRLLERNAEIRDRYRHQLRYIMVDEYQDTNSSQYRMLQALVSPEQNICVVGDDDQSIYGFRGADHQKILGFARDFRGARTVTLEENYRSTSSILELANAVIACNVERHAKRLQSKLGEGVPVRWVTVEDEATEVSFVVSEIDILRRDPSTSQQSIAILMRSSQQGRAFESELRLRSIPYRVVGGPSYFDRKEIRDILAYWKVASNPDDDVSLLRIINTPRRGFGKTTLKQLDEFSQERRISLRRSLPLIASGEGEFAPKIRTAASHLDALFAQAEKQLARREFPQMARQLLADACYDEVLNSLYTDPLVRQTRQNAIEELLVSLERWAETNAIDGDFGDFLAALTLEEQDASKDEALTQGQVVLMTLHSAKGLEFPFVFLVGVEEDVLPHKKSASEGDRAIEEERRLFYVGITRAQRQLVLTQAASRTLYGKHQARRPSRFLEEVQHLNLVTHETLAAAEEVPIDELGGVKDLYRKLTQE